LFDSRSGGKSSLGLPTGCVPQSALPTHSTWFCVDGKEFLQSFFGCGHCSKPKGKHKEVRQELVNIPPSDRDEENPQQKDKEPRASAKPCEVLYCEDGKYFVPSFFGCNRCGRPKNKHRTEPFEHPLMNVASAYDDVVPPLLQIVSEGKQHSVERKGEEEGKWFCADGQEFLQSFFGCSRCLQTKAKHHYKKLHVDVQGQDELTPRSPTVFCDDGITEFSQGLFGCESCKKPKWEHHR